MEQPNIKKMTVQLQAKCTCSHALLLHRLGSKKRKCEAMGCKCKDFTAKV
jgi:hypothetical protein